ncbi:coil containing protein [Vibrio phage 1.238.A._10N.261.52.F10]|uniref:Coil containing protein n=2 Tax=Pariacacavirus TaxID=2948856 RepID=A0A2I7RUK3_9CAUD|nr:coil containing protein [Vibrio phage 1.238.A._10N.261.52.F10]YP_010093510.1 coil containing protein [Vibrio phage 1.245.O._10N.261.54.C7]AUR97314.1 coil containing protein [Vibrio phage 1.238.A._10N.261.52.F10]AUR97408.1 coil containing protein [Vibrio phage 1.238.B._10N.261.52.F10]AUR97980.1 coil containing protein [Vibrio phage 1.245.O._10N.261.54.C7]
MKMSDVFDLPVSQHIDVCEIRSISEIAFSADVLYPAYVFEAINSHDSMVERIAQLEADKAELLETLSLVALDAVAAGGINCFRLANTMLDKHK